MQKKQFESVVRVHAVDGREEDQTKFVEIEGVKYQPDPTDPSKPLEKDGKKVEYVAPKAPTPPAFDPSKASLEDLANANPEVKKLLDAQRQREEDDRKKEEDEARAKGELDGLLQKKDGELKTLRDELTKRDDIIVKHKETFKTMLDKYTDMIPEDRRRLVPQHFSERQKLDYILENADLLGVNLGQINKGGTVPKNEDTPPLDDEAKVQARWQELMDKGATRTNIETAEMTELGTKLKEIRKAKEKA